MSSPELDNLVRVGKLKSEAPDQVEFDGLLHSGATRLRDAKNASLGLESRFALAYSAAHAFSLAALRWRGYRSGNRYVVFQVLPHTLGLGPSVWRVLAKSHEHRNATEYEGRSEIDEQLLADLLTAADAVYASVQALGLVP